METEPPENPSSEGSVTMADDPLHKKDDHQPSNGPAPDKQDDCPLSTDCPVDKQNNHTLSTGCSSCLEQGKTCDSTCVSRSAETKENVSGVSIARKVKEEPIEMKVKDEQIDLEDSHDIGSHRNDSDDGDDCIIVLDIVPGDKKKRDEPKADTDEILIISDDEDSIKGDEEPSTSSKNLTTKEQVETEPVVDSSVSSDIQVDQVKTVTDIDASHSLLEPSFDRGDPITKAVCEVVQEFTDHHPTPSTAKGSKDESNSNIDGVTQTVFPSSPPSLEGSEKSIADSSIDHLGWSLDNPKDTLTITEPPEEMESTDLADAISEKDDEEQDVPNGDIPFGNGYDSDGWQVNSDDESNKDEPPSRKDEKDKDTVFDAAKTDDNAGKGLEAQQIMERSDTDLTRQEDIHTNPRPVQIIPVDSDLTSRQGDRPVPIGIIPIASEPTTRLDDVAVSAVTPTAENFVCESEVTGTGESGKHTFVCPVTNKHPSPMELSPAESHLKTTQDDGDSHLKTTQDDGDSHLKTTQDDGDSPASTIDNHGLRSRSKKTSEGSIDEDIRSEVTRSKLRSSASLLNRLYENENLSGKRVEKKVSDVVKGNLQPDNPVFNCHLCFCSFSKKSLLEEHLINHPQVTRIMCKYCNTSFNKQRNLKEHLKRCYSRKKRKSPRKALRGEPQDSTGIKEKRNSLRRSEQLSSLKTERRKLDFPSVKKEFPSTNSKVANHKSPDTSDVKHECKICGKKCLTLNGLYLHHTYLHVPTNRSLGNKDQKDGNLRSMCSMKLKDNHGIWLCPTCHGSFSSRSKVKRHMYLTHNATNAKDALDKLITMPKEEAVRLIYYCPTCKESFRSEYMFDCHKNTKKGRKRCEKLFQCNLCFNHFDKKVACASHVQGHLGSVESRKRKRSSTSTSPNEQQSNQKRAKVDDDFKCRYCDKSFEFKYLCTKHEFTHTDQDPWHCYICFKIFYLVSSIVAHMEKVHKEVSYCKKCYCIMTSKGKRLCIDCDKRRVGSGLKCSICKTEFVKPSDLTHHILTHDESKVETSLVKAPKASKVLLDPKFQNVPSTSVHPPSNSLKKSNKTKSPVNDIRPVTRSQKEALPVEKATTNAVSHKSSVTHSSKISPLDTYSLKRSKAPSRPKPDCRRVTRSLSDSLPMEETPTTETVIPGKHTRSNYDICMKCGEQDILPKELSKHARIHLDVRSRFQCNTCQQCFVSTYEIEEHACVGNHQGSCSYTVSNVVYQCRFCTRDFQNLMEARKHVLSTNTSCLLECTVCKAEYSRQGDLMVHMVSIHGQYLECDKCSAQFTRQIDLDCHTRQHEDMNH